MRTRRRIYSCFPAAMVGLSVAECTLEDYMKRRWALPVSLVSLVVVGVALQACARPAPLKPEGRYRVESVFSKGKAWMEFKGEEFWYLTGTEGDRVSHFTVSNGKILLESLGGFEGVGFFVKPARDGGILLYLDSASPGGHELLASVAGEEADDADTVNATATAFNGAIRKAIYGVFKEYPCIKLMR